MNNNEAILNKMIELGYVDSDITLFDSTTSNTDYFILQRALFEQCHKRKLTLCTKYHGGFDIGTNKYYHHDEIIFQANNTSRESFRAAFCKVVGI